MARAAVLAPGVYQPPQMLVAPNVSGQACWITGFGVGLPSMIDWRQASTAMPSEASRAPVHAPNTPPI